VPERDRDAVGFTRDRVERGDGGGDDVGCGRGDAGDARVDARDTIARVVTVVVVVIVDVERRRASTNRASFAAASSEGRRAT